MNSIDKLFLLDAYALIYRAYYAFIKNPRINSKGFNTSAILGFVNTLEEVLKKENPTHIGVAFDPSGPTFRHEAYEQYKAQREETPEAIRLSVPIIKDIIRAYRIPILEVSGYEADDVIGTLATEAGRQGITTYMMTPDKDYGQLVSDRVFMYRPKHTGGFEVMGTEEVKTKFNIQTTEQVIDMLGLMGDASDNIPGCPGVGEKTAQKLIAEFGSIENLLEHTDQLKGRTENRKWKPTAKMITFSKFLATNQNRCSHSARHGFARPRRTERRGTPQDFRGVGIPHTHRSGTQKGKRQFVLPYSNLSGTRPLCRDSVCPAANLHSRKTAPRFKAICLQILRARGRAFLKIQT